MVEIKGHAVRASIEAIRSRLGEERFQELVSRLDEPTRELVHRGVQATDWISLDDYARFLDTHVRHNFEGDASRLTPFVERIVEQQLRGVYKAFAQAVSPEAMLEKIWVVNATYARGVALDRHVEKGKARVRYTGFEKQHQVIEYLLLGFYRKAIEVCGGRDVKVAMTTSIGEGRGFAEIDLRWNSARL